MSHGRVSGEFGNNIFSLDFPPREKNNNSKLQQIPKKDPQVPFGFHTVRTFSTIRFLGCNYLLLLYGELPPMRETPLTSFQNYAKNFSRRDLSEAPNAGISRLGSPTCPYLTPSQTDDRCK